MRSSPSSRSKVLVHGLCAIFVLAVAASCPATGAPAEPLVSLPMSADALGAQWHVMGELSLVHDEILAGEAYAVPAGKRLILRSTAALRGAYAVEALVRFPSYSGARRGAGSATLECGVTEEGGKTSFAYSLAVAPRGRCGYSATARVNPEAFPPDTQEDGQPLKPRVTSVSTSERFPASRISPVWEEEFRVRVENAMAKLPAASEVWRSMRIEVRPESVRIYQNGFLVAADGNVKQIEGAVTLTLAGDASVAALEVRRLDLAAGPYVPVPLDSICNAVGPVDASSLPAAAIGDIPFLFPVRTSLADHVDVGESLFRYLLTKGHVATPSTTWPSPTRLDPARIMLRVPKAAYRRAWILAASDGEPNSTPVVTLRFFRVAKGWPLDSVARVPEFTATTAPEGARRVSVMMKDGTEGSLWLLPLDIDPFWLASDFREETVLNIELTKEIKDWRLFPDPAQYDAFQGGLPSAVRLYGLTLEKAPVSVIAASDRSGNLYTDPEKPVWLVDLASQSAGARNAQVTVEITGPYGAKSAGTQTAALSAGTQTRVEFRPELGKYGLHKILTTVNCEGFAQSREGAILLLPPDTRKDDAKTSRWGLWNWGGGHSTNPNPEDNVRLLHDLGCRIGASYKYELRKKWGLGPTVPLLERGTPAFAWKDPYDPEKYAEFSEDYAGLVLKSLESTPDLEYVTLFAEHSISLRVTHSPPSYAFTDKWWDYTQQEADSIRAHYIVAKAAFEGVRKHAPDVKCLFAWAGPLFGIPFMREGFPSELFDGFGVDSPQFERMPERPPRSAEVNHMYFASEEAKRWGYEDKEFVHVESYFPSSNRLALGHRGQADSVVRTAVISLAQGTDRFLFCWTLHDCEDYWGTQHYGCIGMIGRRPEYNPKPAGAAFATMTQMLDSTEFDGYLPTGSRSAYCVRFKGDDGRLVYCLWTVRGSRPVGLTVSPGSRLVKVDENGNQTPLPLRGASVTITPTPIWVVARNGRVTAAAVGTPTYTEAPGPNRIVLDDFERGTWTYDAQAYPRYAENHWDLVRKPGPVQAGRVQSSERRSGVMRVRLARTPIDKQKFVSWYGVYTPREPILIPGKARALGIYAKGNSGWGRIIYEVTDAKGEIYLSCGTKDAWNCDDTHSWSYFNFDGWRHMQFPLPGNSPGDNFREKDAVWWGSNADGVVDLPLRLTKVIFEMQTHQIYVSEILPYKDLAVEVDDLMAVYDSPEMMTDAPVRTQRAAASARSLVRKGAVLPNPITQLAETGVGEPTEMLKLYPPEQYFDGTRVHVSIRPVEGATQYRVWVSAYPDGRGAQALVKTQDTEPLVRGLKPDFPLYFFVTYTDADGKVSKPSPARKTILKDEFLMK